MNGHLTEDRLNGYLDGALAPGARSEVERHLDGCARCRDETARLRTLLAAAAALPRSIEPPRDLWAAIAARINQPVRLSVRPSVPRLWLAAAAVALIVASSAVTYFFASRQLRLPETNRPAESWAVVEADYRRAAHELRQALAARRASLAPRTVAVVEENLRVIDGAIGEARAALARDPASPELAELLAAAYEQQLELLRWAARLAAS